MKRENSHQSAQDLVVRRGDPLTSARHASHNLGENAKVGGHAYQLVKDGYTFDMGPSIITAPD